MKIFCIGDSITYGTGASQGISYPHLLKLYFNSFHRTLNVCNGGMPGYSTKDYFDFLVSGEFELKFKENLSQWPSENLSAVIVMLGTNDCRMDNWVETPDSMKYLQGIIEHLENSAHVDKNKIFLCSILPLAHPMPQNILGGAHPWKQERVEEELNPAIKILAQSQGINFIDTCKSFKVGLSQGEKLYDGIHPFNQGYQWIADTIGSRVLTSLNSK